MTGVFCTSHRYLRLILVLACAAIAMRAGAQFTPPLVGGVYIDTDGTVRVREADTKEELGRVRAKLRSAKDSKLAFVSIPKTLGEVRALRAAGKEIPHELSYLGGITQIRYVFIEPEGKDLLIAGPAEALDVSNPLQPVGVATGRPALQLDDFVVMMRTVGRDSNRLLGCTIDMQPDAMQRAQEVLRRHQSRSRRELTDALRGELAPQTVQVLGAAADTRLAWVCVAADYRLKRFVLGIEPPPVAGLGHAIDNTRAAGNRYWFETMYEPLLVSADGNAFEFRGQRLMLKAGALAFDDRGATPKAMNFAKQFTSKLPEMAKLLPLFADLQNLADWSLLVNLIREDRLDQRIAWDTSELHDGRAYPVGAVPVPRTAETLVNITSGSLTAGGVSLGSRQWVEPSMRQKDEKEQMTGVRRLLEELRAVGGDEKRPVLRQR